MSSQGSSIIQTDNSKWIGVGSRFQGTDIWKLGDLLHQKERSVYKLTLKDKWTQNSKDANGRGNVGLVKVSWTKEEGRGGGGEVKVDEITVNEENQVWLIIAKGQESIYLMPVVRYSADQVGGVTEKKPWTNRGQSWGANIDNISEWTKNYDKSKKWETWTGEYIKKLMGEKEFKIKRGVVAASIKEGGKKLSRQWEWALEGVEGSEDKRKWLQFAGMKGEQYLYLNAGMLEKGGGEQDEKKYLNRFLPLDFAVLGDSSKISYSKPSYSNFEQTITIKDKITQVIGVRL